MPDVNETIIRLEAKVEKNQEEIQHLRGWKHDMLQKPHVDGLRLSLIEKTLEQQSVAMEQNTSLTQKVLTTLNGDDDRPGLKGRLDRIEQVLERYGRFVWLLVAAVVAVAVKVFWNELTGRK